MGALWGFTKLLCSYILFSTCKVGKLAVPASADRGFVRFSLLPSIGRPLCTRQEDVVTGSITHPPENGSISERFQQFSIETGRVTEVVNSTGETAFWKALLVPGL